MAIAIDPEVPFDFILEADRDLPVEQQTVWKLKPLTFRQRQNLRDQDMVLKQATDEVLARTGTRDALTLRAGIVGVENFRMPDGTEVVFECEGEQKLLGAGKCRPPTWEFLSRIHPTDAEELAKAIRDVNRLDDEDTKD